MKLINTKIISALTIGVLFSNCGGSDALDGKTFTLSNVSGISASCTSSPTTDGYVPPIQEGNTANAVAQPSANTEYVPYSDNGYVAPPPATKAITEAKEADSPSYEITFSGNTFTVTDNGSTVSTGTWSRVDGDTLAVTIDGETFTVDYSTSDNEFMIEDTHCASTTKKTSFNNPDNNYHDEDEDWDLDLTPDRYDADPYNPNVW